MNRYRVSIIPRGGVSSTYHGSYEAPTAEQAAAQYIGQDPTKSIVALVAQRDGGIVVVTPEREAYRGGGFSKQFEVQAWGVELFHVGPEPQPSAVIKGRVRA